MTNPPCRTRLLQPYGGLNKRNCHRLHGSLLLLVACLVSSSAFGQTTFSEAQRLVEDAPSLHAFTITDFDRDGDLDIVAITADDYDADALVWFENDGMGRVAAAQMLLSNLPEAARALTSADLDDDGNVDFVLGDDNRFGNGGLYWTKNEGGHLSALRVINAFDSGIFRATDFDRDGDLDIVQGGLSVRLYEYIDDDAGGRFRYAYTLAGGPAEVLTIGDFNQDGKDDLFASHRGFDRLNDIGFYYEQRERGPLLHFSEQTGFYRLSETFFRHISVAEAFDVDGDEATDLVVATFIREEDIPPYDGSIVWYRNIGTRHPLSRAGRRIARAPEGGASWGAGTMAVADFDGDGDGDVAMSTIRATEDSLFWYENPGLEQETSAGWAVHIIGEAGLGVRSLVPADLDSDGDNDLVTLEVFSGSGTLVWYENLGASGTATEPSLADEVPATHSLRVDAVWPNPSQQAVRVTYEAPAGAVHLAVFDVLGRKVASRILRRATAGHHTVTLDLMPLAAGAYVLRLDLEGRTTTHPFVVTK